MSIVESIKRLVEAKQAYVDEQELESLREEPEGDRDGGKAPPKFRCRVCGHIDEQGNYCALCLADTMQRVKSP